MVVSRFKSMAISFGIALGLLLCLTAPAYADELVIATEGEGDQLTAATVAFTSQNKNSVIDLGTAKGKVVNNGTFYIGSAKEVQKVILANKSALAVGTSTGNAAKWQLTFDKDSQAYYIVNAANKKALSVKYAKGKKKPANNSNVFLAKVNKKSDAQKWRLYTSSKGYALRPMTNTDLKLTINASGKLIVTKKNVGVQRYWLYKGGPNFLKTGTYTLSNGNTFLNVPKMSIKTGKKLNAAPKAKNLGQVFDVIHVSKGFYRIVNVNSGMLVTGSGNKAIQKPQTKKNKAAQLWKAQLLPSGEVMFVNQKTRKSLLNRNWTINPATTGLNAVSRKMLYRANQRSSDTKYCIIVDLTLHELCVFKKAYSGTKGGPWKLLRWTRVSSGSHGNWTGAARTSISGHSYTFGGFNCFYWTHLRSGGNMHSLLYASASTPNRITDGRLGKYISHGCVRMPIEHAKWIYNNCGRGTAVTMYYK